MMRTLSIILPLGFVNQVPDHNDYGDEFGHMAPLVEANCDVELIIVDRAWPNRWDRVEAMLGSMIDRVAYVPPKPSVFIDHGYRAVSSMRNAGAICSDGHLLAFVDDHLVLDPRVTEVVCEHYLETGRILCPADSLKGRATIPEGPASDFSGHNPRIYMSRREDFIATNGFDEQFDGTWGEEDTDWENRIDRHLSFHGKLRQRKRGLLWLWTEHANGKFVQEKKPFWPELGNQSYLRCNRAYYQRVCYPRMEANNVFGNVVPTNEELDALRGHICSPDCKECQRADRNKQIESYKIIPIDDKVSAKVQAWDGRSFCGLIDPWESER
jgi:hypothetical protein